MTYTNLQCAFVQNSNLQSKTVERVFLIDAHNRMTQCSHRQHPSTTATVSKSCRSENNQLCVQSENFPKVTDNKSDCSF